MATTLNDMLDTLRRSYLKDLIVGDNAPKWEDEDVRDFIWWALDTFAEHTAAATSVVYLAATGSAFTLPDNVYDDVSATGLIYLKSGTSVTYVSAMSFTDGINASVLGCYLMPETVLHLTTELDGKYDLHVHHFAYYNRPYALTDTIDAPRWAEPALSYLATAHALMRLITSTSNIRRFADKRDSGNPEHNPMLQQRDHLLKSYERELMRRRPQDRTTYWRRSYA